MAADHADRAKSTYRSNADSCSLHDGTARGNIPCGGDRCPSLDGPRPLLERASSMPGRIPPASSAASCGGGLALLCRGHRPPRRAPSASQPEVAPPPPPVARYETEAGATVGSPTPEVFVSAASAAASADRSAAAANTALLRHLGSTSFSFRRKRVLGVPVDENNVPQIDRAVSPLTSAAGSPTTTKRDVSCHAVTTREPPLGHQPIYTRRFASLRLPRASRTASGGITGPSAGRPHPSSSLLSPAAANGASDHRALGGSYARMQLLQNIGKHE